MDFIPCLLDEVVLCYHFSRHQLVLVSWSSFQALLSPLGNSGVRREWDVLNVTKLEVCQQPLVPRGQGCSKFSMWESVPQNEELLYLQSCLCLPWKAGRWSHPPATLQQLTPGIQLCIFSPDFFLSRPRPTGQHLQVHIPQARSDV